MSQKRLICSFAAALGLLLSAAWLVTTTFPLAAAPQIVADAPGVAVDLGNAGVIHRAPVAFPEEARRQGIQGTVVVQAKVDGSGSVTDAQVLSGPEELRKSALASVLNWHFTSGGGDTRQVAITFQLPAAGEPGHSVVAKAISSPLIGLTVGQFTFDGISDAARTDLQSRLPVHEGDTLTAANMQKLEAAVHDYDQHLVLTFRSPMTGPSTNLQTEHAVTVEISPATSNGPAAGFKLRVGGNVQSKKLQVQPKPVYPPDAKQAHVQGVVKLSAIIGKDGTVQDLNVISGHPLLVPSALQAVKQWVYEPTLLNGEPVTVATEIDVNYTLSQ